MVFVLGAYKCRKVLRGRGDPRGVWVFLSGSIMIICKDKIVRFVLLISHTTWLTNAIFSSRIPQILFALGQKKCRGKKPKKYFLRGMGTFVGS